MIEDRSAGNAADVALQFRGVSKWFGDKRVNHDISFAVRKGEVVALLGENGAGKTTLMNILFGHYRADAGEVEVFGRRLPPGSPRVALACGVGMVHQHFALAPNLSVQENITIGTEPLGRLRSRKAFSRKRIEALSEEYSFSLDPDRLVADLSVGQRQRVEILKVLYRGARLLVLDEPTAVLSPHEAKALFAMIRKLTADGMAVIFISHKLHEVLAVADRVVVLRHGELVAERPTKGSTSAMLAELMVGRSVSPTVLPDHTSGSEVLRLQGLTLSRKDGTVALDGINLSVCAHQILGIAGVSGNGQSELAELLSGMVKPDSGKLYLYGEVLQVFRPREMIARRVGRIPEDRHEDGVAGALPLWENAILEQYRNREFARFGCRRMAEGRRHGARIIEAFDIRGASIEGRTSLLSGGNMQKVILARVMSQRPGFIVASHPARGLDVGAIEYVHSKLIEARRDGAAVVLISDDLDEIMQLSDRIAVMYQGRVSEAFVRDKVDMTALGLLMAGGGLRAH